MNKKIINQAVNQRKNKLTKPVINYMGGTSYEVNPLDTLKMVSASSIFAEPQYYRKGAVADEYVVTDRYFEPYSILEFEAEEKTSSYMEKIIDASLEYDFKGTLEWAKTLRKDYYMRLNPQVIMVRASVHPNRINFNEENPGLFSKINQEVMSRADEPASQLAYYLFMNGSKNNLPNILKRNWKTKLESLNRYALSKYKNSDLGMIDVVRISHANNELIDELMKNGKIEITENEKTWENLRSEGKTWKEILSTIKLGHMALLRNLVNIWNEIDDKEFLTTLVEDLKAGVLTGKQFPFRYHQALKMVKSKVNKNVPMLVDALNECMEVSLANMPKLKGRTMCLSDNSGSAWGTLTSEYGSVKIAVIDNLSSVIIAKNSDEGYVGKFGDELEVFPISKKDGILTQTELINNTRNVGEGTENGVWIFLHNAIEKKEHWDNIFIFSDMQAGHGELYGTSECEKWLRNNDMHMHGPYIDVAKMVDLYRKTVNPKVNVFSVQTAGYDNVVLPEYGYRTNLLYGWTGKELVFADAIINEWNNIENSKTVK